jgi:hypothetical protein
MHKRGVPSWQRYAHAGTDEGALARLELDVGSEVQVAAGVPRMGALRQRQVRIEPADQDLH